MENQGTLGLSGKTWHPVPQHRRHPAAHAALVGPDWNTDDYYLSPTFTLAEKRDPFLDLRLIEFIFSLPSLPWLFKKHILRRAMEPELPGENHPSAKGIIGYAA